MVAIRENIFKEDVMAMSNLPSPRTSLIGIMSLLRAEEIDFPALVKSIHQDQALVARILKMVNSSYYHLRYAVDSINVAVALLGAVNIKNIVYSSLCFDFFSPEEESEWKHSYTTSLLVSELMRNNYISSNNNLQLSSLLHDIGKVVLRRKFGERYQDLLESSASLGLPLYKLEEECFGHDHSTVGAWLLESWNIPDDIVKSVAHHHLPGYPNEYAVETMVLKYVDWVDNAARGVDSPPPQYEILEYMGFLDFEKKFMINSQKELISSLEGHDETGLSEINEKVLVS